MKKNIHLFLLIIILIALLSANVFADTDLKTNIESGILIDFSTGQILYEKDAHIQRYPSSTTKILTALIILENHTLDEIVTVDKDSPFVEGSKIFIFAGEELTVEQLLSAMLVTSANDCAEALAIFHSGSIEEFSKVMNKRAIEIGALNSNFVNPHGLHDDNHYSTAYDLSLIARETYKIPNFREIVALTSYSIAPTEFQPETRIMHTTNHFLNGAKLIYYNGEYIPTKYSIVDGIKTGYTTVSKSNLVSTAQKNGIRLISVVLKSEPNNVYVDSRKLLDYGFDNFKYHNFTFAGNKVTSISIDNGTVNHMDLFAESSISGLIPIDFDIENVEEKQFINEVPFPILENDVIGRIQYFINDTLIGETNLITDQDIFEMTLMMSIKNTIIKKDGIGNLDYSYYLSILLNIFISFIIWRTIITIWRIQSKKKRLKKYL